MPGSAYKVVVKSSLQKVLFESAEARLIEIFDNLGNLCGILVRAVDDHLWMVSVKGDPDFEQFARQNGYKTATIEHPIGNPTIYGKIGIKA
jgi:hypothetical protein